MNLIKTYYSDGILFESVQKENLSESSFYSILFELRFCLTEKLRFRITPGKWRWFWVLENPFRKATECSSATPTCGNVGAWNEIYDWRENIFSFIDEWEFYLELCTPHYFVFGPQLGRSFMKAQAFLPLLLMPQHLSEPIGMMWQIDGVYIFIDEIKVFSSKSLRKFKEN